MQALDLEVTNHRQLKLRLIQEAIDKTKGLMYVFPRDLYLPAKLAHLKELLEKYSVRTSTDVVHIEELQEIAHERRRRQ